jgi:peptide/nickel transport system ATP-binding protein
MSGALVVEGLSIGYRRRGGDGVAEVVHDLSFALREGRLLGIAGESGCGKSTAALRAIGFPIPGSVLLAGSARLGDVDLLSAPLHVLRDRWGSEVAYVAQDATQALSPLMRVEHLLAEPLTLHRGLRGEALRRRSLELLASVGIPDPEFALRRYPHQFSGGQQQRIALAIALSCEPRVLVLDEPTTGLDVTTQARVAALITRLVRDSGAAALFVSHDLGLLATSCDDLAVMYAGEIVERGAAADVLAAPRHPYASALLDAVPAVDERALVLGIPGLPPRAVVTDACSFAPRCAFAEDRCRLVHPELEPVAAEREVRCVRADELGVVPTRRALSAIVRSEVDEGELLAVRDVSCAYRRGVDVVRDVSLVVRPGETVGLVGESGSGKSTLLRAVAGLVAPRAGSIAFRGETLAPRSGGRGRDVRRAVQLVFQDPAASLNPRHTIGTILSRPLAMFAPQLDRAGRRARALELMGDVRLDPDLIDRYPHELSGGQKQRVSLARAFAADPDLILCDEVVSALDVSVQATVLELLARLAAERGTALLFVTHDLAVVRSIADRVCVMRDGEIVERGTTESVFADPRDDYTRTLLDAVPRPVIAR